MLIFAYPHQPPAEMETPPTIKLLLARPEDDVLVFDIEVEGKLMSGYGKGWHGESSAFITLDERLAKLGIKLGEP